MILLKMEIILEARKILLTLKHEMDLLVNKMSKIPHLMTECLTLLPSQLEEVTDGYEQMTGAGFGLSHLQMDKELERLKKELNAYKELVEKLEVQEAENGMNDMKESLEVLYDLLEKEVHSKHYVIKNRTSTKDLLFELETTNDKLIEETEFVEKGYHLQEEESEIPSQLEKNLSLLAKRYEHLEVNMDKENGSYSLLSTELKNIKEELENTKNEQHRFKEKLLALRKDEMASREAIEELLKKLKESSRMLDKSKIPGIPEVHFSYLEEANERVMKVQECLQDKPLNMQWIQKQLDAAESSVEQFYVKTEELIENVMLVEKVIQYGNRYRRNSAQLDQALNEAEIAFRNYRYETALEIAVTSIEKIEPGAIKRIEKIINEEQLQS